MTKFDPHIHHRRSIRLKGYDYTRPGAYFLTLVTENRERLFGEVTADEMRLSTLGKIAWREWERLPQRFRHIRLDEFVIMPNHIHGIIVIVNDAGSRGAAEGPGDLSLDSTRCAPTIPTDPTAHGEEFGGMIPGSIAAIVRAYKSAVTLRVNYARATPGVAVWQRNYYEHIIRDEAEWGRIRQYIVCNPRQWVSDYENIQGRDG